MLIFYYFFIVISILGYGSIINENVIKYKTNDLGFIGLIGLFFLVLLSYFSSQFLPHTKFFNTIILMIGFVYFFYTIKKKKLPKEDFKLFFLITFIFLIFIIIFKNHDDFGYYHFPYIISLTKFAHIIGMGNLNLGFNTHSSIFMLASIFHLPGSSFNLFHLPAAYYIIFANFTLIKILFDKNVQYKNIFLSYLTLSVLIFINLFFYRLAEHGTDRSAMVLILLLIIKIFYFLNNKINFNELKIIFIISSLIISLKAFYILYILLLFPIFSYIGYRNILSFKVINSTFYLSLFMGLMVVLTNFINSGCFLFPQTITCVDHFSWSQSLESVKDLNIHYENWAKAGAVVGYENTNKSEHIQNLNWLTIWIDKYFFNKVSDFLLSLFFIGLLLILIFCRAKKIKLKRINYISIYLIILFLLLIWFFKFPALRYGGYHLIFLSVFIPISIYLSKYRTKNLTKKFSIILIIVFTVFFIRNLNRIYSEIEKYEYNLFNNINYHLDENYFRINNKINNVINNKKDCDINKSMCFIENFKIRKIFKDKYIIYK